MSGHRACSSCNVSAGAGDATRQGCANRSRYTWTDCGRCLSQHGPQSSASMSGKCCNWRHTASEHTVSPAAARLASRAARLGVAPNTSSVWRYTQSQCNPARNHIRCSCDTQRCIESRRSCSAQATRQAVQALSNISNKPSPRLLTTCPPPTRATCPCTHSTNSHQRCTVSASQLAIKRTDSTRSMSNTVWRSRVAPASSRSSGC